MVSEIETNPAVDLRYQGKSGLLGHRPFFVAVEGRGVLIRDRAKFDAHWTKGLERWWPKGTQTPGLVLIQVIGRRAHYWDGEKESEIPLEGAR